MTDSIRTLARMFTAYKAWADDVVYTSVSAIPGEEALKPRQTLFGNMVHTLNHLHVVDDIFRAHLEGRPHDYTSRNATDPPLAELWQSVKQMDRWYIDHVAALSDAELHERIAFQFIGGGDGNMSRLEIVLHVVNHGTYHRGFVSDMLNQVGVRPPAGDLTVFLRDVWPAASAAG